MNYTRINIQNQTYEAAETPDAICFPVNWSGTAWNPGSRDIAFGWAKTKNDKSQILLSIPVLDHAGNNKEAIDTNSGIITETGFGFTGEAFLSLKHKPAKPAFWSVFIQDVFEILLNKGYETSLPLGFTAVLHAVSVESSGVLPDGRRSETGEFTADVLHVAGLFFVEPEHISRDSDLSRKMSELIRNFPVGGAVSALTFAQNEAEIFFAEPETSFQSAELSIFRLF